MMLIHRATPDSTRGQRAIAAVPVEKLQDLLQDKWNIQSFIHPGPALHFSWSSAVDAASLESLKLWLRRRGWGLVATYRNKSMLLTPLYGTQVPPAVSREYHYHVTDAALVPQILRRGLLPRARCTGDRCYPPRVYLVDDFIAALFVRDQALKYAGNKASITQTKEVTILEIDLSRLRKGTRFYPDPEYGVVSYKGAWDGGFFTPTHIPPAAIDRVDKGGALTGPNWAEEDVAAAMMDLVKWDPKGTFTRRVAKLARASTMRTQEVEELLWRENLTYG